MHASRAAPPVTTAAQCTWWDGHARVDQHTHAELRELGEDRLDLHAVRPLGLWREPSRSAPHAPRREGLVERGRIGLAIDAPHRVERRDERGVAPRVELLFGHRRARGEHPGGHAT